MFILYTKVTQVWVQILMCMGKGVQGTRTMVLENLGTMVQQKICTCVCVCKVSQNTQLVEKLHFNIIVAHENLKLRMPLNTSTN